jgi:hypothetical protein
MRDSEFPEEKPPEKKQKGDVMMDSAAVNDPNIDIELLEVLQDINCFLSEIRIDPPHIKEENLGKYEIKPNIQKIFADEEMILLMLSNSILQRINSILKRSADEQSEKIYWDGIFEITEMTKRTSSEIAMIFMKKILEYGVDNGFFKQAAIQLPYRPTKDDVVWRLDQLLKSNTDKKLKIRAGKLLQLLKLVFA